MPGPEESDIQRANDQAESAAFPVFDGPARYARRVGNKRMGADRAAGRAADNSFTGVRARDA